MDIAQETVLSPGHTGSMCKETGYSPVQPGEYVSAEIDI